MVVCHCLITVSVSVKNSVLSFDLLQMVREKGRERNRGRESGKGRKGSSSLLRVGRDSVRECEQWMVRVCVRMCVQEGG